MSLRGPSVAYMKGQSGAVGSVLAKRRLVLGWNHYYFVFFPKHRRLYQYRSELVRLQTRGEGVLSLLEIVTWNKGVSDHTSYSWD